MPPVVDAHAHLIAARGWRTEEYYANFARVWGRIRTPQALEDPDYLEREVWPQAFDPHGDRVVAEMDEAGIDITVFMPMDQDLAIGVPPVDIYARNRTYAEICRRHQGRLYSFCGIDPRRPDALPFFRHCIGELGMRGLKLYPPTGFYPHDDVCQPLLRQAADYGVPVLFHTGFATPGMRAEFSRPIHLDEVAWRYPDLNIVLGHTAYIQAGAWWQEAVAVATYKPNVFLDVSTWQGWSDEPEFVDTLCYIRDRVGAERILWASDRTGVPLKVPQAQWVEAFRRLPEAARRYGRSFTGGEVDAILGGNALALYGLTAA